MSDTPITDAVVAGLRNSAAPEMTARDTMTGLACNLERRLAEVTKQRDTLETALKDIADGNMFPRNRARLALAAVKQSNS